MGITPPEDPPIGDNFRLPSGAVLHEYQLQFIQQALETLGADPSHIPTHFHDVWHREIAAEDVEAIAREDYSNTTQPFQSGFTDVEIGSTRNGRGRLALVPTGVYHDIIRVASHNETNAFISTYMTHRYRMHIDDSIIDATVANYEAEMLRASSMHATQPVPGARPRHTGHRITSLPQTPVTAREGRPRTSFVGTPPPMYSPARAGGHPLQVRFEVLPPHAFNYDGRNSDRREIAPPYTPPPEYRYPGMESDDEGSDSEYHSAAEFDVLAGAQGGRRNGIENFADILGGLEYRPRGLTGDNRPPRRRHRNTGETHTTTTGRTPALPRRSSLRRQPATPPAMSHIEPGTHHSPPRPTDAAASSRTALSSHPVSALRPGTSTRSAPSTSSSISSGMPPATRSIPHPDRNTDIRRSPFNLAPAPGRRVFTIERYAWQSPGPAPTWPLPSTPGNSRSTSEEISPLSHRQRSPHGHQPIRRAEPLHQTEEREREAAAVAAAAAAALTPLLQPSLRRRNPINDSRRDPVRHEPAHPSPRSAHLSDYVLYQTTDERSIEPARAPSPEPPSPLVLTREPSQSRWSIPDNAFPVPVFNSPHHRTLIVTRELQFLIQALHNLSNHFTSMAELATTISGFASTTLGELGLDIAEFTDPARPPRRNEMNIGEVIRWALEPLIEGLANGLRIRPRELQELAREVGLAIERAFEEVVTTWATEDDRELPPRLAEEIASWADEETASLLDEEIREMRGVEPTSPAPTSPVLSPLVLPAAPRQLHLFEGLAPLIQEVSMSELTDAQVDVLLDDLYTATFEPDTPAADPSPAAEAAHVQDVARPDSATLPATAAAPAQVGQTRDQRPARQMARVLAAVWGRPVPANQPGLETTAASENARASTGDDVD